jgi:hypothetical protein
MLDNGFVQVADWPAAQRLADHLKPPWLHPSWTATHGSFVRRWDFLTAAIIGR